MNNEAWNTSDLGSTTEVREIPREIFEASCGNNRLAAYYGSTLGTSGRYLVGFHDGTMAGHAICKVETKGQLTLCQLFVKEEYRHMGIAAHLLKEVEALCLRGGWRGVKCCVSEYSDNFVSLRDFFEKRGYVMSDKLFVFWCDGYGDPGYAGWERYMEKHGESLVRWLEDNGFAVVVLEDAGEEMLSSLRELGSHDKNLNVSGLLDGKEGPLSRRISCITVKNDHPVAFCMANTPDDVSVIFERIGVTPKYRNTGAILPAISASIRRCKKFGYERVIYSIFESNVSALSFAKRVLSNVTSVKKVQYNYFKQIMP